MLRTTIRIQYSFLQAEHSRTSHLRHLQMQFVQEFGNAVFFFVLFEFFGGSFHANLLLRIKKHSRHIYDIYKLLPLVKQDDAFRALVREVRAVRKESVICPSAADGVNIPELLAEMIQKEAYREDYRNLTEKLLEEEVDYDTAVTALERIAAGGMFA